MATLTRVKSEHKRLSTKAYNLVEKKGRDYNRKQQRNGDTLYNITVAKELGIVDYATQSIMVRLCDKVMRLASLTTNPNAHPAISDESIDDTICDLINYAIYLSVKYKEERK